MRKSVTIFKWTTITIFGSFVFLIVTGIAGIKLPFLPWVTDVTAEKPFSDFIGREYRVIGPVEAMAWNDFPNKEKILVVTLESPAFHKSRFVSFIKPVPMGATLRILSAVSQFAIFNTDYDYKVSIEGMDLPSGVPIELRVNADGVPDKRFYEEIVR